MLLYTLHESADSEPFASLLPTITPGRVVRELSGREPGPWLGRNLHRTGRCYVACTREARSKLSVLGGAGFVVRKSHI